MSQSYRVASKPLKVIALLISHFSYSTQVPRTLRKVVGEDRGGVKPPKKC